jgi:hypothetical protein
MDKFSRAYIEAALWSSTDNSDESGGRSLDCNYGVEDIAPETLARILQDCTAFQEAHAEDIGCNLEQARHDFWLTRNHHVAGFWDSDWQHEIGKRLTEASHAFGSVDLDVGDDGLIYS